MSNIQYTSPGDEKHRKRKGSVYQSGSQLFMQHRRINPRDEKTPHQQFNRTTVQFAARMWKDLSAPEQATWTPCPGETLTGFYLYMSVNIIDMEAGNPLQRTHTCPPNLIFTDFFWDAVHSLYNFTFQKFDDGFTYSCTIFQTAYVPTASPDPSTYVTSHFIFDATFGTVNDTWSAITQAAIPPTAADTKCSFKLECVQDIDPSIILTAFLIFTSPL